MAADISACDCRSDAKLFRFILRYARSRRSMDPRLAFQQNGILEMSAANERRIKCPQKPPKRRSPPRSRKRSAANRNVRPPPRSAKRSAKPRSESNPEANRGPQTRKGCAVNCGPFCVTTPRVRLAPPTLVPIIHRHNTPASGFRPSKMRARRTYCFITAGVACPESAMISWSLLPRSAAAVTAPARRE